MVYVRFFLEALWYTLGPSVVCGLGVSLCRRLFLFLLGRPGRGLLIATSVIGTPVHELGHALMCLLFGHRITRLCLWDPRAPGGDLGFVTHQYDRRNPLQVLGLLLIGLGPILLGTAVLTLTLWLCFPEALEGYTRAASALPAEDAGAGALLWEGLELVPRLCRALVGDTVRPLWARAVGVLVLLSVSLHMELSFSDIRSALRALPLYGLLLLLLTAVCALLGAPAMAATAAALARASAYTVALFSLVFAAAALQLVPAVSVWVVRTVFLRR